MVHVAGQAYHADMLFIAEGRVPVLSGLNLEAAKVELTQAPSLSDRAITGFSSARSSFTGTTVPTSAAAHSAGIRVNSHLQTSVRHIYAAGGVLGDVSAAASHGSRCPALAAFQGFHAARNALLPGNADGFPSPAAPLRLTLTDPEVAAIGITPGSFTARTGVEKGTIRVLTRDNEDLDRPRADGDLHGFVSLAVGTALGPRDRDQSVLGATVVGGHAGEVAAEVALAMTARAKLPDLALTLHATTTYAAGLQVRMCTEETRAVSLLLVFDCE
jgi:pyruvate/2-oxoglutarate dehydrogenase complex dihydrolipoamide dehydrogenase (E3) component